MKSLRLFLHELDNARRFNKLPDASREFVFYAEFSGQWAYFEPIIDLLTEKFGQTVCYLTSSPNDPQLQRESENFYPFYIGSKSIRTTLFASLRANLAIMTFLDFDNFYVKRSKYPVHYVYLPHNMLSTHMVFNKGAHDNFDTVVCVGPHHLKELREAESLYNLPCRELVEGGYVRLDAIYKEAQRCPLSDDGNKLNLLIAPSWGKHGLFESDPVPLIENLLWAGHSVTLRPHRETLRRASGKLDRLRYRFEQHANVHWAGGANTIDTLLNSHMLITDWSGSGFSFAFGTGRPVLFLDLPRKINNPDYQRYKNIPIEVTLRSELGGVLPCDEMINASKKLAELWENRSAIHTRILGLRKKYVFNFGKSAEITAKYLVELAKKRRPEGD